MQLFSEPCLQGHKTKERNGAMLGNHPGCPNLCCSLGTQQDQHISLEDSLGQYVSKPITSLAGGDVMPVH